MFDIRRYEMLLRLNAFGAARPDQFPASSAGGKLFAALDAELGELRSHVVAQAMSKNAARQSTVAKNGVRDRVRRLLVTLIRTAKIVTASMPGLAEKFRLPSSRSDQRLLAAARALVKDATPFGDAIVAQHLSSTFLADVTAAIDDFQASIQMHATAKESRAAARAGIDDTLAAAFTIAGQLDTLVANQCGSNVPMLAEWNSARHVSLVSVPYPKGKPAAAPTPTLQEVPRRRHDLEPVFGVGQAPERADDADVEFRASRFV